MPGSYSVFLSKRSTLRDIREYGKVYVSTRSSYHGWATRRRPYTVSLPRIFYCDIRIYIIWLALGRCSTGFTEKPLWIKDMPSLQSATLAVALLGAGYLSALCTTPPNPDSDRPGRSRTDRIAFLTGTFPKVMKHLQMAVFAYHALVALLYPADDSSQLAAICPRPENLPSHLFTWNTRMLQFLTLILLGAFIRLSAYGGLGQNFTFHLSNPDRLITDGVYQYLQHPSYTGAAMVTFGMAGLLTRWDTAAGACWMQASTLQSLDGYGWIFPVGWAMFLFLVLGARVRDEEAMLKEQFGKEWEEWHARTKRFIPGVI